MKLVYWLFLACMLCGCGYQENDPSRNKEKDDSQTTCLSPTTDLPIINLFGEEINRLRNGEADSIDITNVESLDFNELEDVFKLPRMRSYKITKGAFSDLDIEDKSLIKSAYKISGNANEIELVHCRFQTLTIDCWYIEDNDSLTPFWGEIYPTYWNYFE